MSVSKTGAWWWFGLPVATAAIIFAVDYWAPDFYRNVVLPEAYGILEISHILQPFAAFVIALTLFRLTVVKQSGFLKFAVSMFALASLFIAGEECSWGQFIFFWTTPEGWAAINRQQETNLHNTHYMFNQLPQSLLYAAILIAGFVLQIIPSAKNALIRLMPVLGPLVPPARILPVSVAALAFKQLDRVQKDQWIEEILVRPSEATETFYYMFILFYMIFLRQRLKAESAGVHPL